MRRPKRGTGEKPSWRKPVDTTINYTPLFLLCVFLALSAPLSLYNVAISVFHGDKDCNRVSERRFRLHPVHSVSIE